MVHVTFTRMNEQMMVMILKLQGTHSLTTYFIDRTSGAQGERGLPKVTSMLRAEFERDLVHSSSIHNSQKVETVLISIT